MIKVNWESLLVRLFATAISICSVLVQASNVQPLSLLQEAGIGQLYITLGLLLSLGILVDNLKRKLDSFVMPSQETERTKIPPPSTAIEPTDELLPPLRNFIIRWEQYLQLGRRRQLPENRVDVQNLAHNISSRLAELDSRYADLLNAGVRNQIHMVSDELRQLGVAQFRRLGPEDFIDMEAHGEKAYELAKALTSFLEHEK